MTILTKLNSIKFITPGVFMSFPLLMAAIWQGTGNLPATENSALRAFEAQGWLIAVIASALGLVRIALWLRGYQNGNGNGNGAAKEGLVVLQKIIENQTSMLTKLIENDQTLNSSQQRLIDIQQRLFDSQNRALDNHTKILESLTIFKLNQENQEDSIRAMIEQIAARSVIDLKETINKNNSLLEKIAMRKSDLQSI